MGMVGFYAGSFDPFTNGHLQIVKKAAKCFDKVIVGIGYNAEKTERIDKTKMKQAIEENILCHYDYYPIFVELTNSEMEEYEYISTQLRKFIDPDTGKYKPEAEKLLLKRKRIIHKAENKKVAISNLLEDLKHKRKLDYTFVFVPEGYEPDYSERDSYDIDQEDIHIIDEYAQMFKSHGYSYHKYISGRI